MNPSSTTPELREQAERMRRYYRFHSKIYDLTRWSFLFGRDRVIDRIAEHAAPKRILEIGCGTGRNLLRLARRFPAAAVTGIDISDAMLKVAEKNVRRHGGKIELAKYHYDRPLKPESYDLILFSYSLSMINPGWREALEAARRDLAPGGWLAVADFHETPIPAFRRWMEVNHVRMEAHLLPELGNRFEPEVIELRSAYCGWWWYLVFLGVKPRGELTKPRPASPVRTAPGRADALDWPRS